MLIEGRACSKEERRHATTQLVLLTTQNFAFIWPCFLFVCLFVCFFFRNPLEKKTTKSAKKRLQADTLLNANLTRTSLLLNILARVVYVHILHAKAS